MEKQLKQDGAVARMSCSNVKDNSSAVVLYIEISPMFQ